MTPPKPPFPDDIEALILQTLDKAPHYLDRVSATEFLDWFAGKNLDAGRQHLRALLAEHEADLTE